MDRRARPPGARRPAVDASVAPRPALHAPGEASCGNCGTSRRRAGSRRGTAEPRSQFIYRRPAVLRLMAVRLPMRSGDLRQRAPAVSAAGRSPRPPPLWGDLPTGCPLPLTVPGSGTALRDV